MKSAYDFRQLKLDGYVNVNEYASIHNQLHACETLFGDRNAEILLLGQDAASAQKVREIIISEGEGAKGFRHGPKVKTNVNLQYCLNDYVSRRHPGGAGAYNCGIFYANVIWLLKDTKTMSGSIKNAQMAMQVCTPVFDATLDGLPNLRIIIALGRLPYMFLSSLDCALPINWREQVDRNAILSFNYKSRRMLVAPVLHPSPLSGGRNIAQLKESFEKALQNI